MARTPNERVDLNECTTTPRSADHGSAQARVHGSQALHDSAPQSLDSQASLLSRSSFKHPPQAQTRKSSKYAIYAEKSGRWFFPASSTGLNQPVRECRVSPNRKFSVQLVDGPYLATRPDSASDKWGRLRPRPLSGHRHLQG
jgi:hypothetical protein